MISKNIRFTQVISVSLVLVLNSCGAILKQPISTEDPKLGQITNTEKRLNKLPPPKEMVMAAVYNFRDKTGQYKLTETGGSWSTAITQGATSILIKSLEESGWFIPIEREGLGNLLNERKIIRSSRAHYNPNESNNLPPLLFAGIMLEGGIISYDHNVQTGGIGMRYFGTGASGEYRQDRVTVYIRAISTQNGKILKTVNATKTILSQKLDAGIFRYVKFKRLLEAETGITYNEPTEIAVKEAIEKAIESLIIEGLFDNLWDLKNPEDINSEIIQTYIEDKAKNEKSDIFGLIDKTREYKFSAKAEAGLTQYVGDYQHSINKPVVNLQFSYEFTESFVPFVNIGKAYIASKNEFYEGLNYLNIGGIYRLTPKKPFSPFLQAGVGVNIKSHNNLYKFKIPSSINDFYPQINGGAGLEYLIDTKRRWGINSSINIHYFLNDRIDGAVHGIMNDYYWDGLIGVSFYF
ncbi:MAG: CsgG/HfaB family protein [Bacteroidales bacterium]